MSSKISIPQQAVDLFAAGKSVPQILEENTVLTVHGTPASRRTLYWWNQMYDSGDYETVPDHPDTENLPVLSKDPDVEKVYKFIKDTPRSIIAISNHLDRSPKSIETVLQQMEASGFNLIREEHSVQVDAKIIHRKPDSIRTLADIAGNGNGLEFTFAVPSDIHAGSKLQQITALRQACDIARDVHKVDTFLFPGDLFGGIGVYRGQAGELYARSAEEQEEAAHRTVPIYPGEHWQMLFGNHDYSWVKNAGIDLGWRFCRGYDRSAGYDVNYLGYSERDIRITDKVSARLWHPSGGVPYSHSYRTQKGMETLMKDAYERGLYTPLKVQNKVQEMEAEGYDLTSWMLFVGHLHIALFMPGVAFMAAQSGCFEGRTLYLKEKGLYPHIGMFVYKVQVADDGRIHRITPNWIGFSEIVDDYKGYDELQDLRVNIPDKVEILFKAQDRPVAA